MEAYLARREVMINLGSKELYKDWGYTNPEKVDATVKKYYMPAAEALFGPGTGDVGGKEAEFALTRGCTVYHLMMGNYNPKPTEPYKFRNELVPNSINTTTDANGWMTITSEVNLRDNPPSELFAKHLGLVVTPSDVKSIYTLTGVHVTEDGKVFATSYTKRDE